MTSDSKALYFVLHKAWKNLIGFHEKAERKKLKNGRKIIFPRYQCDKIRTKYKRFQSSDDTLPIDSSAIENEELETCIFKS